MNTGKARKGESGFCDAYQYGNLQGIMGTFIVAALLAAAVAFAIRIMVKDKKKKKGGCSCSCSSCGMAGKCHKNIDTKD